MRVASWQKNVLAKKKTTNTAQGKLWPDEPQHVWQRRFYDFHVWNERKRVENAETPEPASD